MKKMMLMTLITLYTIHLKGQSETSSRYGTYFWNNVVPMYNADRQGNKLSNDIVETVKGQKFVLVMDQPDSSMVLIRILNYNSIEEKTKSKGANLDTNSIELSKSVKKYNVNVRSLTDYLLAEENSQLDNIQKYFLVDRNILEKEATRSIDMGLSMGFGVVSLPFKIRLQNKREDFTSGFNLGAAIGLQIPHKSYHKVNYTILFGYSIGEVNLDTLSISKGKDVLDPATAFNAFSISTGLMAEYGKVQVGILVGWDHLDRVTQNRYDWDYQGKPWLSFGFGYSIFTVNKEKTKNSTKNELNKE